MDKRLREPVFPVKVLASEGEFVNLQALTEPCDLQIGLSETHLATVRGKGFLVFDFGKELHGGVRILAQVIEGAGTRVRIRTGESVSEVYAEAGEKNAENHHALRDITVILPMYSDQEFLQTGFRFLRVDFLEEKTVLIKSILATSIHRDLKPMGSFVCSDVRVNRIFEVASRTLMLNMQNYIWDGIKRDRLVWVGDMHPETLGIECLFGADETVEPSLSYAADHTPLPDWINAIPCYTAWWLVVVCDYYLQNGNRDYLLRYKNYIEGALARLAGEVTDEGVVKVDSSYLFDWPSHNSEDEKIGIHALWTLAAKKSAVLFEAVGLDSRPCTELIEKLSRNQNLKVEKWKQCEAFLVYAGLKDAKESFAFLTQSGAKGFSTFMSYYLLSAIADSGNSERALELMKEYYGGMLDMGATSFWEDFNLEWTENSAPIDRLPVKGERDIHGDFGDHCYVGFRHSLCHGWSCGPVPFLIKKLGGIEILEAGCKKVRVNHVSAGRRWYKL